jgi:hypothetical protein
MTNQTVDEGAIRVAEIQSGGRAPQGSIRICSVSGKISLTPTTLPSLTSGRGSFVEPMAAVVQADPPVLVVASPEISLPAAQDRCACGHLLEHHDRIAARYCAATTAGELSRDCICTPPTDN